MAKILVISDDGSASAEVVDATLDGEVSWFRWNCSCTAVRVYGDLAVAVLDATYHLDHHKAYRPVRSPVVGG